MSILLHRLYVKPFLTYLSTPYRPIITFIIILLLPSCLTFLTLLIHRIRAARAAQRDRAPESVVFNLPSRVWNGAGWEKEQPTTFVPADVATSDGQPVLGPDQGVPDASTSQEQQLPPWVEAQAECAICLEMFAKGDRVRVLPCKHFFHMKEVDEWLITKKKVVRVISDICILELPNPDRSVLCVKPTSLVLGLLTMARR